MNSVKIPGYPDPYPHQDDDPPVHVHFHAHEHTHLAPVAVPPVPATVDPSLAFKQRVKKICWNVQATCNLVTVPAFLYVHFSSHFAGFGWVAWFWILQGITSIARLVENWWSKALRIAVCGPMIGAAMNATVMLNNGGWMPVSSPVLGITVKPEGVWRPLASGDQFVFLADRFAGWSLGDFVIIGTGLILWRVRKRYEPKKASA